jgi:hypothetical protein
MSLLHRDIDLHSMLPIDIMALIER